MRELSDEEVFGSTKELSDADVFGKPAEKKSGIGSLLAQAAYTALRANPTLSVLLPRLEEPKFKSVMEDADPRPFNFAEASKAQRKLDDLQPSKQQFVSQAPQIDDGIIDAASRIGRKSIAAINELPAGVVRALGDAIGSDAIADFAKGSSAASKRFANKTQAPKVQIEGFTPDSIVQRLPEFAEGAAVSTATQLPVMLTGSLPLVYANMFGQSAGNKYNELRDRNIDPRLARSNAAITGAAEVIGERVGGMPGTMAALRGAIAGNPVAEVADKVFKASLRDIPGENLTTGIEYGVDALQGINPDPSLRQYLQAARDTTIQTMLQGGGMTAGITGIAGASNLLRGNRPPAPAEQPPTQPNDVISRVMGQPVPATTAQATTAPPAMDQNAVADRIIAAITGESKQPAVELSDAEVFGETNITTQTEPTKTLTPQGNIPSRRTALKDEYSKLQRRLDEDGKSTGDDPLGRALNATYNPLLSNEKDEQLHALNYGEQNNRPDIAAEAKANLATLADKLEQDVVSQSTTPGVPESSPKYQKIKTDLEARKAKKAADAAEIRARLGQPTAQAAQTQASKVRVKNPINGFHGTPEQFDEFSIKNEGELGDGFYFTFDREGAQKWGHRKTWLDFSTGQTIPEEKRRPVNIMQAKLHLQNPASFKDVQAAKKEIGKDWTPAQVTELLKSKGFDGVVSKEDNEIVVFDSGAIELNKKQDVTLTNEGKMAPIRLGVDNVPMADGGKPFKTKLAAQKAKKLQPMMRVVQVEGGFALADKTPKQLAAEAKAAKRIRGASTGNTGTPMSVHEFIAAEGGLSRSVQSDLGIEGNVKIGNRWLYAGPGKGMTIEQAAEKLKEAGYIDDELHNTAYDIIRRSINDPQYTPEGWEQVAEAEREAQFEDYLAAEQEAPADDNWTILTPEELAETGYNEQNEKTQAEIRALVAQAEAMGIDADSIMEDVFYATQSATKQDYENAAKTALQTAIQGSNGSGRQDSGQTGTEEGSTEKAQPEEGLTSYTPQEIEDRLAKLEQAEQERQQQAREAEQRAEADAQRDDFTLTGSNRDADVAAARGQRDIFSAPGEDTTQDTQPEAIEPASSAPRKQTPGSKIEDFGEKIGGARKDVWTSFKDQLGEISDKDIASQPLSKIWPQPDYQALLDNGADPWTVAFARAARDEIPSKPRQSWKVKRWAEQVRLLRSTTTKLMDGSLSVERAKQLMTQLSSQGMRDLAGRVELYTLVGHGKSLDGVRIRSGEYSMYNRVEYNPPKVIWTVEKEAAATAFSNWPRELATGATREEALKAFKEKYDSLDINPAAKKEVTFDIYSKRGQDGYFIGKKVGRNYIDLAGPFENVKAARDHKATKQAELVAKLEKAKEIPQERRDTNEPRVGEDMRNGQDVTPQMFGETFGFRGVEFGNWVEQGRRQKDLNDAFDALMDMAAVLDIPPKAISLNGELGLAFGARGGGGVNPAAAHYEPGKVVINLTKKSGAGSLGHEWWHALDNYFSRMRAKSGDMMTGALDVSLASRGSPFEARGAVRREMIQAFGQVMKSIKETAIKARSAKLDAKRSKEYWTTDPEMSARAFESYLISKLQDQDASNDYLANIVDPETWKAAEAIGFELEDSYPYPTAGEIPAIRAGFDHFFQTIETRETDKGVAIYSQSGRSVPLLVSERVSPSVIEDEIEKRLAPFGHKPEIIVLDTAVGVIPGASDSDAIAGAVYQGRIYLFRDQLATRFDVQKTLFHEMFHYGLRRFLTKVQFIAQMNKLYERDADIKAEADRWVKTPEGRKTAANFGAEYAKARGVDEALATLAEVNQGEFVKKDWVSRSKVTITRWLAQLADFMGFKDYAANLRAVKSEEARQVIQDIFGKLREDASPARDAWNEAADPAFKNGSKNRDAMGRVKFRLGEVALAKLDAATRPLQERFGMRMASPELRRQLRTMKATIDQANRSAANVAQQMKDMPEADRAMVSDIVEKMIAPGVVPPEHAVRVADAITKTMDRQTDELVALGMLSQDSADRWRGRYLPRIYNRKTELGEDTAMDAVKNMFKTGRPTMQGIGGGSLKGRGLFQDVSVDAVDQWLGMGYEVRDPHWKLNQGKLELVDKNAPQAAKDQVTVWRDWTPSERAQMGENRDALFRYVQGYTNMQRDIALGRLFNQIANNPDFVRRSASEGWVKVPDTEIPDTGGVKRYGNLAGLYVRQDVMSHLSRFEESANETLQLWRDALGLWKEGKTALNPVAHFNNIASNISMAHFAGVSYWDGHKYVGAARDLANDAPMVEEARNAGLFTGSFTKEELMQNMPPELQKLMQMEDSKLQKAGRQVINALTFWLRKPLQNAYEFEDTYFKYLIYRDARQQGMSPEAATDYALKYIFTYDDLPSGARKVRDFAIPFFSWTYKAMPALLHTAMVYPWRFLAPAAMLNGINLVAYALAAGDDDDDWLEKMAKGRELEKEEREALPERARGTGMLLNPKTIRLGTDSVTGNPVFLDASRVVPGGDMFDMENQAGGLPIPAPLMPNHPVLSAFSAMIANKELFMGREVVDKNDTGLEAAEKRAKWMAGFMLPAVAPGGYHSQRILDATANAMDTVIKTPLGEFTGVDRSGLPVQPKYAAMQTLGVKARPVDLELEASRRKAQESALVNSIAAEVRSMSRLYQKGAVSDDMMDRTREKAREKIERMREKE